MLFKHLVSLGYINFNACADCQKYLNDTLFNKVTDFIDISSQQWYWDNPFDANKEEYHIIFDVKDIIDKEYKNHLTNDNLSALIDSKEFNPHVLYSNKIGITIKAMLGNKRLVESQKEIAFSDKSIKEIAYEYGYKDPAYFNRVFKANTGKTPTEFKEALPFEKTDLFVQDLLDLLHQFHQEERNVAFYAEKMHLSVKTLSNKVRDQLQISIGQLIRQEIIQTARKLLQENRPVKEVAFELGFEETNHFSSFFKNYTTLTPTEFQNKKYKQ